MTSPSDAQAALQNGVQAINSLSATLSNILPPGFWFNRFSQFTGATVGSNIMGVQTLGYYAPGDGGGATYIRSSAGGTTIADGSKWFIDSETGDKVFNAKQYGAKGDGVTSDTQSLLNWIGSGNPDLYLPPGTYLTSATLSPPNTVRRIFGPGTLQWNGGSSGQVGALLSITNGVNDNLLINGLTFHVDHTFYTLMSDVFIPGPANDVIIRNCFFPESGRFGILMDGSGGFTQRCGVEGCVIQNFAQTGIWGTGSSAPFFGVDNFNVSACFYRGNIVVGTGSQTHHCMNVGGFGVLVEDNIVTKGVTTKFLVGVNGGRGTRVINNFLYDAGQNCDAMDVLGAGSDLSYFVVSGNTCANLTVSDTSGGAGIAIGCNIGNSAYRGVVSNNVIFAPGAGALGAAATASSGVGSCYEILFTGNVIVNPYQQNSSQGAGYFTDNNTHDCLFLDNYMFSEDGKCGYGYGEFNGEGSSVPNPNNNLIDSEFRGFSNAPFLTLGTNTFVRKYPYLSTTLPSCHLNLQGERSLVTNANSITFSSIVASGGANIVPVYSDGTNWRIG